MSKISNKTTPHAIRSIYGRPNDVGTFILQTVHGEVLYSYWGHFSVGYTGYIRKDGVHSREFPTESMEMRSLKINTKITECLADATICYCIEEAL